MLSMITKAKSNDVSLLIYMKLLYCKPTNFGIGVANALKKQQGLTNANIAIKFALFSFAMKTQSLGQGYNPESLMMEQYYLKIIDTLDIFLASDVIDNDTYCSTASMFRIMGDRMNGFQVIIGTLLSDLVMLQGDIVVGEWDFGELFIPNL
ncbi:hypothetical protein EU408_11890 [Salmonella enterica subsp. enterica]|nr:hypothetical protein [Salmonella enterica subsp. enterica serovar Hessarek]ECI6610826.1 hypothetical protein [Salmonella enterica subsp. enterica]EGH0414130.1 hypothetical protein [Salmonella enterica subsp. enterica serovar Virchow]EHU7477083.1 hypothetical protein [Salmonella enterica]EIJ6118976.1 hypothetical protein [Salmonella enterica subsp. enterica serovar Rubislaw]